MPKHNPFTITVPGDLARTIAKSRETWAGWTMMADDQTPPAGEQQGENNTSPQTPQDGAQQPESGQQGDYRGAGSKDALKADLVEERSKRQALEAKFNTLTEGMAKAFGIETEQATPEQLQQQLQQATGEKTSLQAENTALKQIISVFTVAPAGVDVQGLIDSRAFTDKLAADKPTDVKAFVGDFVKDNPRFMRGQQSGGDIGAGHGPTLPNVRPGVDRLASAFEQEINKN